MRRMREMGRLGKKAAAGLCAGLMIMGTFSACGTKNETAQTTAVQTTAAQTSKEETTQAQENDNLAGSYTCILRGEELAGKTAHNGFISAIGVTQINKVTLNEDGTYEYVKQLAKFDADGTVAEGEVNLVYTFTGTYTAKENEVTLASPEDCVFDENWGSLDEQGYLKSSSGTASKGDKVVCKEGEEYDPMSCFPTEYYVYSDSYEESVVITVDAAGSFTYNAVANSDDE